MALQAPTKKGKTPPKKAPAKKGKAKKAPAKKAPKEEESLEELARRIVNSKKTASQSYFDVSAKKAYVASARWKKTHEFYKLGEKDTIYLMATKGKNSELVSALKELGFVGTKPIVFSDKKKVPKKPVRTTKKPVNKKEIPKKVEKIVVTVDKKNQILKDSKNYVYIPTSKGKKLGVPRVFGKWNGKKVTRLLVKDIKELEKRGAVLYNKKAPTLKEITKILSDYRKVKFPVEVSEYSSSESEEDDKEDKEDSDNSEIIEEKEEEVNSTEDESDIDLDGSEDELETKEDSDEEGEEDGVEEDIANSNEKDIEEVVENPSLITEEMYKRYLEHTKDNDISNIRATAKTLKVPVSKLNYIISHEKKLAQEFPAVKVAKGKAKKSKFKKRGLDLN